MDIPAEGSRTVVRERSGYVLYQNRPLACRPVCKCGNCDGRTAEYPGTVEAVTYWADNTVTGTILCDDGIRREAEYLPPSGDRCY